MQSKKARRKPPPTHRKKATTANTTNPKNYLTTVEHTVYSWGRREDYTKKGKEAEP